MKALVRALALLLGAILLIVLVPNAVGVQAPRNEHLTVRIPDTETLPPIAFTDRSVAASPNPSILTPRAAAVPAARDVLSSSSPEGMPVPRGTPTLEDALIELRAWRKNPSSGLGSGTPAPAAAHRPASKQVSWDVFVHLPPDAAQHTPLRVLLALHGMGGKGDKFAQGLLPEADRNGWVVIAPTLPYERNYMDPVQLMDEDLRFLETLHVLVSSLPERLGLKLHSRVLVFGFSRGAQIAHRFALFHPEQVESVAAISAGSYTLPLAKINTQPVKFPYGIADLSQQLGEPLNMSEFQRISFWIAVGAKDNRQADVARAFDAYDGLTRVERAQTFANTLRSLGIDVYLTIYPNADHEVTLEMREGALKFLRQDELADNWYD